MNGKNRHFFDCRGSVLMEFLLVIPVYFALWGGLFTAGELLLLNNRLAVAERNMGYLEPFLLDIGTERGETQIGFYRVAAGLSGRNAASLADASDFGYARRAPRFTFNRVGNSARYVAETKWGYTNSTALTVGGIEFPSFIQGMVAVVSVFAGDAVNDADFVYTLGALGEDGRGRYFLMCREPRERIAYRENCLSENGSSGREYLFLETALKVSGESTLGTPPAPDSGSGQDAIKAPQEEYTRIFGGLFSEKKQ
ncbi:MAG: hypothetical protein IJS01_10345 [Lentisphaeria bacterium]|nr:hypothetical protein [Lentisphaeria bacterium]